MKTKKCGQNSLKLTSMMTQKRKHLKCASYIKKQKEFLRENYHYNLGKKRFPKTNFEKYETNRLIFCKMNIPEQIKETQGRVDHFIAEIKVWNRENKEELRYWNQEKKDARKSGIEEDLKNAREELNSLKNDKKVLETQRDIAISRLNELEKSMKENKKRKVFYKLNSADTQNLVWLGAQTNCRRFVDSFQKQYKAQHARFAQSNLQKRSYEEGRRNQSLSPGCFGCELDIEKKSFEDTIKHMKSSCQCHKTFAKIFQENSSYDIPSDLDNATIKAWRDLSNVLHGEVAPLDGGVLLIPSDLTSTQKRVLARLASVVGYKPLIIRTDSEIHGFDDDELLTPKR
eukprot:TRINITY_DN861_c0_g1_i15.p1 TRINITY_DN861_c0_g1~~TRINITY_DN861_c0_g1_i15.p1  ORF type:complete len:343 (-),score=66.35 TRINITY_DN861_c0_g1_i15:169-1197(-)